MPTRSSRSGRGCCAWSPQNLAENAIRYAGPGSTSRSRSSGTATTSCSAIADDGVGVVEADLPAAVRALLPGRPRARLARDRARARDREARRRVGGRDRRGARRPRSRARDRCVFPCALRPASPLFHQTVHQSAPHVAHARRDTRGMNRPENTHDARAPARCWPRCSPGAAAAAAATTTRRRRHRRDHRGERRRASPAGSRPTARARSARSRPRPPRRFSSENPASRSPSASPAPAAASSASARGETDLSNASRPIDDDEIAACEQKGIEYVEFQVANDALTVVVNTENDWADVPDGRRS